MRLIARLGPRAGAASLVPTAGAASLVRSSMRFLSSDGTNVSLTFVDQDGNAKRAFVPAVATSLLTVGSSCERHRRQDGS